MANEGDLGNDAADQFLELALSAQRAARGVVPPNVESAGECMECGLSIPSERQIALPGVQFCVDCQELLEIEARR